MDKQPEKFTRNVAKIPPVIRRSWGSFNWEDLTNEDFADFYFRNFLDALEEQGKKINEHTKILEIGSGNAVFMNFAKKWGINMIGVDARPRGENNNSQVLARIEQLPFPDESFEIVTSNGVFDTNVYYQNPELMVKEISRILKPGGIYLGFGKTKPPLPQGMSVIKIKDHFFLYKKV